MKYQHPDSSDKLQRLRYNQIHGWQFTVDLMIDAHVEWCQAVWTAGTYTKYLCMRK